MNTIALEKILRDLNINEKISLVELILSDLKRQSNNLFIKNESHQINKKMNINDYEFCGIWESNSHITDSTEYVRNLRKSEFRTNL